MRAAQASLATRFRDLNRAGRLLLPNAWDVVSARLFEQAGFPAIGHDERRDRPEAEALLAPRQPV